MSIPKDIPKSVADQLMELQQQNESLRKVIRQMREEIENIEAADGKPRSLSVAEGVYFFDWCLLYIYLSQYGACKCLFYRIRKEY